MGTQAFLNQLRDLAQLYTLVVQALLNVSDKLGYNDISLPTGGLFDYRNGWTKPHSWHRFGMDADVRNIAAGPRRTVFALLAKWKFGVPPIVEGTPPHFHVCQLGPCE